MSTEHVIFRSSPDESPKWTWYSMPSSTVGGADTLNDAKRDYLAALAFHLDVVEDALPTIVEHTEYEVADEVWVRVVRDEWAVDRQEAVDRLRSLMVDDPSLVSDLSRYRAAGGEVVIVASYLIDTVASILSQLTEYDTVWVVAGYVRNGVNSSVWVPLSGEMADGVDTRDATRLSDMGVTASSTVQDLLVSMNRARYLTTAAAARAVLA